MKKLLCLLVAICAGAAAGQEAEPTVVEGATYQFGNTYVGAHSTEKWLDGGEVTVRESAEMSSAMVVGNENDGVGQRAYWGKVTMTGGEVDFLIAVWCPHGDAGHGTVVMLSGTAHSIIGGQSVDHEAYNNTVIMTGGTAKEVIASNSGSAAATFNNIYLIGKGGEATIDDVRYTHTDAISIKRLYGATGNDLTHNAIDFYGTGIEVGRMDNADILAFHLTAETSEAIFNLSLPLDLVDVTLNFSAAEAMAVGSSITRRNLSPLHCRHDHTKHSRRAYIHQRLRRPHEGSTTADAGVYTPRLLTRTRWILRTAPQDVYKPSQCAHNQWICSLPRRVYIHRLSAMSRGKTYARGAGENIRAGCLYTESPRHSPCSPNRPFCPQHHPSFLSTHTQASDSGLDNMKSFPPSPRCRATPGYRWDTPS